MCGTSAKDNECLRLVVDHWRAHSIYNIDSENIAVLLCEKCNNIHHNKDASQIALKYKSDMRIVTNWRNKELEIRSKGYMPNNADPSSTRKHKKNYNRTTSIWCKFRCRILERSNLINYELIY